MYGQTEATARMAYLPPRLARRHPGAIGVPIPGGSPRAAPCRRAEPDGVGELVYRGAERHARLRRRRRPTSPPAPTLDELATGDLGRFDAAAGVFEIVGRRSRFVKPFGVRIDLDVVERELARDVRGEVAVGGDDDARRRRAPGATRAPWSADVA